jgi:hypothetical protein
MNRKLITSKDLIWPDINEKTSEKILQCIQNELANYPEIQRPKTLPKRQREEIKKRQSIANEPIDGNTTNLNSLKYHFLNGINTITRYLEKPENLDKILCILVCKSTKRILVQHLLFISSQHQIKAGCIANLSNVLPKLFNIKTTSAIAIRKCYDDKYRRTFDRFESTILPLLPSIENPFESYNCKQIELDNAPAHVQNEDMDVDVSNPKKRFKTIDDIFVTKVPEQTEIRPFKQSFEFISFDTSANVNMQKFDEKNFILFKNAGTEPTFVHANDSSQDECFQGSRYFEDKADLRYFKQFDIVNRKSNANRKIKEKKGKPKNKIISINK